MPKLTVVKAEKCGKNQGYMSGEDFKPGTKVVVENASGVFLGTVMGEEFFNEETQAMILHKASDVDIKKQAEHELKVPEFLRTAKAAAKELKLEMKILTCEITFDNSKIIFYFSSDGRVDFRELVKNLARDLKARIELKQIGARDETKIVGGLGACGKVCCCKEHLGDFCNVNIKMAKAQGLSLNPASISGLCGRLMCCLAYENEYYEETAKVMPRIGSDVDTPDGKGIVAYNDFLRKQVTVKLTDDAGIYKYNSYALKDLKIKQYAGK